MLSHITNPNTEMIIFLNLKGQICKDLNSFAFYDTVSNTFCGFGDEHEQIFSSIESFKREYSEEQKETTRPLSRFIRLIPDDFFDAPVTEWINTSDQMPFKYKMVIINFEGNLSRVGGKVTEGWWNGNYWDCYARISKLKESITVAKWMPKPNP